MVKLTYGVFFLSIICAIVSGNSTKPHHRSIRTVYNYGSIDTQINNDLTPQGTMRVINSGPIDHEINIGKPLGFSVNPAPNPGPIINHEVQIPQPLPPIISAPAATTATTVMPIQPAPKLPMPSAQSSSSPEADKPKSHRFSAKF